VLKKPAFSTFPRLLHSPRTITLAVPILDIVSGSRFHVISVPLQISSPSISAPPFTARSHHFQHSTRPTDFTHTTQCLRLLPLNLLHPFQCFRPSVPASPSMLDIVDKTHHLSNMTSGSLHKYRPSLASLILPLNHLITFITDHQHKHKRDFFLNLPDCVRMDRFCRISPVPAVPGTQTLTSFLSRPPVFNSSVSYHEMEVCRVPSSEPDSIQWNSPPTSSGLPVTPPDHTAAPQLPCLSQRQPPKSPQPHYVSASMLPFSPIRPGPAFSTGNEDRFTDVQDPLKSKLSLNEGTKDVFQSLKRKRLPVAASFSRPRPRTLPVKKVLPKIHGCRTCGKMFDRPSTLLVVSMMPYLAIP
jgi:hypothetical protein